MIRADALLVIARRPAAGQSKTRLCPPLTAEQGAGLYECFLADTLDLARRVDRPGLTRAVLYTPAGSEAYFARLAPDFALVAQVGETLGERLDNALTEQLRGHGRVVIVGSDSPTLPVETLAGAFDALAAGAEVVFGPAEDGGYTLVGVTRPIPRLLREAPMSAASTLAETLALAREDGLRVALLPPWYDVDTPADLARLRAELASAGPALAPRTRAWLVR